MAEYLIAFNDEWVAEHTPQQLEHKRRTSTEVVDAMREAGVYVFGNGGIDASTCVGTATARDGRPVLSDGPYVETKEHLGGFCVIAVGSDEEAMEWAGRMAVALDWPQEVHRFPGATSGVNPS